MQRKLFSCWGSVMLRSSRRRGKSCLLPGDPQSNLGHCQRDAKPTTSQLLPSRTTVSNFGNPEPPPPFQSTVLCFFPFFLIPHFCVYFCIYFVRWEDLFHGEMYGGQRTTFGNQSVLSSCGSQERTQIIRVGGNPLTHRAIACPPPSSHFFLLIPVHSPQRLYSESVLTTMLQVAGKVPEVLKVQTLRLLPIQTLLFPLMSSFLGLCF